MHIRTLHRVSCGCAPESGVDSCAELEGGRGAFAGIHVGKKLVWQQCVFVNMANCLEGSTTQ